MCHANDAHMLGVHYLFEKNSITKRARGFLKVSHVYFTVACLSHANTNRSLLQDSGLADSSSPPPPTVHSKR